MSAPEATAPESMMLGKNAAVLDVLACPVCKAPLAQQGDELACAACAVRYPRRHGVPGFITRKMYASDAEFQTTAKIIEYWGNGWVRRFSEEQHATLFALDGAALKEYARECVEMHRQNQSIMIDAIEPTAAGKLFLNIGSGAGGEALVIAAAGARCIAMDITAEAAGAAESVVRKLGADGFGIQADARYLPLQSSSMDGVYSSGVLHHSPNIEQSVAEIHRVLKPGGKAYVMLYATWSILFIQPRLLGFLRGNFSRARQLKVMSEGTEHDWRTESLTNPFTTTFTATSARRLFHNFAKVEVRKAVFSFRQIMILGRALHTLGVDGWLDRSLRFLNPVLGACLFITAEK